MKNLRGFTIVELIVVMVIIGILTSIITTQMFRSLLLARDKERENDVKIIANTLEEVHRRGQINGASIPPGNSAITSSVPMGYPSTALVSSPNDAQTKAIVGALDQNSLKSPFKKAMSLVAASNTNGISGSTAGGITLGPSSANDVYVYQPLTSAPISLCTQANSSIPAQTVIAPRLIDKCIRYNIYYYSETKATTQPIQVLTSKSSDTNGL